MLQQAAAYGAGVAAVEQHVRVQGRRHACCSPLVATEPQQATAGLPG